MKFKGTVWMLVAFAGLALYFFFVEVPGEEKKQKAKELSEKILPIDSNEVQQVSVTNAGEIAVLERKDDLNWRLIKPLKANGDDLAVEDILSTLESAIFKRVVEEAPKDPGVYGLKEPSLKISLQMKDGKNYDVLVGDNSPIGHSFYVMRKDQNRVLLTSGAGDEWKKSLYDLRDKTVLDFETPKVKEFQIQYSGKTTRYVKDTDGWMVHEGFAAKGDATGIDGLLNSLQLTHAKRFVEEAPKSLEGYGLDKPQVQVDITLDGEDKPLQLLIGSEDKEETWFAKRSTAKNIITLDKSIYDKLTVNPLDYLDKDLFRFEDPEVLSVSLKHSGETIELKRGSEEGALWKITAPGTEKADQATVSSLLFDLKDAKIVGYIEGESKQLDAYGLDQPSREMSFETKDKKILGFSVGNETEDKAHYFSSRTGETPVFILKKESIDKIFRSLHDLKDKKLFHFEIDKVAKIILQRPNDKMELVKKGDEWSLTNPKPDSKFDSHQGNDILWTLGNLEYQEQLDSAPEGIDTGFSNPTLTLEILDSNDTSLGKIEVGAKKDDSNLHFARIESDRRLFTVQERFLKELEHKR